MTENEKIAEYLAYYFGLEEPQYAVMLKGAWGSGKTWFIEQCLNRLDKKQKYIYVSLYGVSSKKEIEDQFFEQLHPMLARKGVKVAAKVLKGVLKGTLNFDWNGDGKSDGSAAVGVPDLKLEDFLKDNQTGFILIFDDVERCDIPMPQLMGYINYFVEHDACRVILLANESEIIAIEEKRATSGNKKDSNISKEHVQYLRIREKLIGKTFEIRPDLQLALNKFVEEISIGDGRDVITNNYTLIADLHADSKYQNLRHLRQALLDFDRIVGAIDSKTRDASMLKDILGTFLVYTFEIRSGNLRVEDVKPMNDPWLAFGTNETKNKLKILHEKYTTLSSLDSVFSGDLWASIMRTGLIDQTAVNVAVKQSKYYTHEEEQPDWLRLWGAFSMDDDTLTKLMSDIEKRLKQCGYDELGELIHVTGGLLSLSEISVYQTPRQEILQWAILNAEFMQKRGLLMTDKDANDIFDDSSWNGRTFHGRELTEFKALIRKVEELQAESREASYPSAANSLLTLLNDDPGYFAQQISPSRKTEGRFARQPVLAHMDSSAFVNAVSKLQASDLSKISRAIQSRYEHQFDELFSEKSWLEKVAKLLEPTLEKNGKMSLFHIHLLYNKITQAVDKLNLKESVPPLTD